jgi:hypothetical protein
MTAVYYDIFSPNAVEHQILLVEVIIIATRIERKEVSSHGKTMLL